MPKAGSEKPKIAVLFWFYKEFEICKERLNFFKKLNPNADIHCLFGGEAKDIDHAKSCSNDVSTSFYHFKESQSKHWKWEHGDEMIIDWFREEGHKHNFDSVFILQWDMLLFAPLHELLGKVKKDQAILSGHRPLDEVKDFWPWYNPEKNTILNDYLSSTFNYTGPLYACLFIVALLPRKFLAFYQQHSYPFEPFLEYKIPSILMAMSIPVIQDEQFTPFWYSEQHKYYHSLKKRNLLAVGHEIDFAIIAKNLSKNNGRRIFHPVFSSNKHVFDYIKNEKSFKRSLSLMKGEVRAYIIHIVKRIKSN